VAYRRLTLLALLVTLLTTGWGLSPALGASLRRPHTVRKPAPKVTVVEPAPKVTVIDHDDGGGFWENLLFTVIGGVGVGGTAEVARRRSKKDAKRATVRHEIDAMDDLMSAMAAVAAKTIPFVGTASTPDLLSLTSAIGEARAEVVRIDDEQIKQLANSVLTSATKVMEVGAGGTTTEQSVIAVGAAIDKLETHANELRAKLKATIRKAA
jgi:hypothetical protein